MACPSAEGLFQQAIPQSGACHHTLPQEASKKVTEHFLDELGLNSAVELEAASADDILIAQRATSAYFAQGAGQVNSLGVAVSPFYPVHGNATLPDDPLTAARNGASSTVRVLTGSNKDETTLWSTGETSREKLERTVAGYQAIEALAVYQRTRPETSSHDLLVALTTDHMFRIPAIRLAEARQEAAPTFMYQFNWRSRALNGVLAATHSLEIPFAFNNLDQAGVDFFLGPGPSPQALADTMHKAWCDFIKTGEPGWPAYDSDTRATMFFDDICAVVEDPDPEERAAWNGIR
jgi:para-nitrobenzyl esterase